MSRALLLGRARYYKYYRYHAWTGLYYWVGLYYWAGQHVINIIDIMLGQSFIIGQLRARERKEGALPLRPSIGEPPSTPPPSSSHPNIINKFNIYLTYHVLHHILHITYLIYHIIHHILHTQAVYKRTPTYTSPFFFSSCHQQWTKKTHFIDQK